MDVPVYSLHQEARAQALQICGEAIAPSVALFSISCILIYQSSPCRRRSVEHFGCIGERSAQACRGVNTCLVACEKIRNGLGKKTRGW